MDDAVTEALDYFRADPHMNGPVLLTPSKMREHLAVIEATLSPATGRAEGEALATGWLASMGREDGEDRGPVVRFVIDANRDHAMRFGHIWDGGTYEIRRLSHARAGRTALSARQGGEP